MSGDVVWLQLGAAHEFCIGAFPDSELHIGLRQLVVGFRKLGINLNSVQVRNGGRLVIRFRKIVLAVRKEFLLLYVRVARTT